MSQSRWSGGVLADSLPIPPGVMLLSLWLAASAASTSVVERIVAQVNGAVITESQVREREQELLNDLYRQDLSQNQLEEQLELARDALVPDMIHELLLMQK